MPKAHEHESTEVKVARIDERVREIHSTLPLVRRHDRELLVIKVLGVIALVVLAVKHPVVAEALAKVMQ